ncbi:hypothetical protein N7451_011583 [Penicillium sp. IBT 35674x]|nr:hypothetical protein N7451_011583 [Penicillium sp. IBT 35674x]
MSWPSPDPLPSPVLSRAGETVSYCPRDQHPDVLIPSWIGNWFSRSFRQEDIPAEWTPVRDQLGSSLPDPEAAIICVPCAHNFVEHDDHPAWCQFTNTIEGTRQFNIVCGRCKREGSVCFQFHVEERGVVQTGLWTYWAWHNNFESGLFPEADTARAVLRDWLGMLQVPKRIHGCLQCDMAEENRAREAAQHEAEQHEAEQHMAEQLIAEQHEAEQHEVEQPLFQYDSDSDSDLC